MVEILFIIPSYILGKIQYLTTKAFWYANTFICSSVFLSEETLVNVLLTECSLKERKEGGKGRDVKIWKANDNPQGLSF